MPTRILPMSHSVYIMALAGSQLPTVMNGAGQHQWSWPPDQLEMSLDFPCSPSLTFRIHGHYRLVWSPVTPDGLYHPPERIEILPTDVNMDGAVNSADFFEFLQLFFAGSHNADWDMNGRVDSLDVFAYLEEWLG